MNRLRAIVLCVACLDAMLAIAAGTGADYFVYVGSYTDAPSSAKGIYAWRFAPATGSVTSIGLVAETVNPAYVYATPDAAVRSALCERHGRRRAASSGPQPQ